MSFRSLKILPLLIVVAMLAFSVRLVDFTVGVASLTGEAMAADAAPEKPAAEAAKTETPKEATPAEAAKMPDPDALAGSMDKDKTGSLQFPDASKPPEVKDETIGWQAPTDSDVNLSKTRKGVEEDMAARRTALDQRERDIQTREALLKAGEQELDRKFQELSQLKKEIEGLLQQQSQEEQARIDSLVKIYQGMKPADAARIFDTLDTDILLPVMSKMQERSLSPVMAAMNADKAKLMTTLLAQQKQLPTLPPSQ